MEFKFSKKIVRPPAIRKETILDVFGAIQAIITAEDAYDSNFLCGQIDVSSKNQRWRFDNIDEVKQGLPPTTEIERFDMLLGCNIFGAHGESTLSFSLYAALDKSDDKMYITSSGPSDVYAQELAMKLESALAKQYEHKPSEAHATESKSDVDKQALKWTKVNTIAAIIIGILTIAVTFFVARFF